jgi:HEAT repeat protein
MHRAFLLLALASCTAPAAPPPIVPPPVEPVRDDARLRLLEAENARLRGELFALQLKLAAPDRVTALIRDGLRSSAPAVRIAAVRAIAALAPELQAPLIAEAAASLDGGDPASRAETIAFLARFDSARAAIAAAEHDPSPLVRRAVAAATREPALLQRLLQDTDDGVVDKSIDTLGDVGDRGAVDLLVAKLQSAHSDGRRFSAINALGKIGEASASGAIRAFLAKEHADNIREIAIDAAGKLKDENAAPALASILGEQKPRLREQAARSLALLGRPALTALADVVERAADRTLILETGNAIARTTFVLADDPAGVAAEWRRK